jgi:VWFA-related protein
VLHHHPPPPSAQGAAHASFDPIAERALAKDPRRRHPSAAALRDDLRRLKLPAPKQRLPNLMKRLFPVVALCLCAPATALAAGARLSVLDAQAPRDAWPVVRAYVQVIGSSGAPIQGLGPDLFKVYERGGAQSAKVVKVQTLESSRAGASMVLAVQASGSLLGVCEELKKAAAAFAAAAGQADRFAAVDYAERAETLAPFLTDRGAVAGRIDSLNCGGRAFLLHDGLAQAISLFAAADADAAAGRGSALPSVRAIVVVSDGRDDGSAALVDKVVGEAVRRKIAIHAIGHSELDSESLPALEQIARLTGGSYRAAPSMGDVGPALLQVKSFIDRTYLVEWKTALEHDGKDHQVEIAIDSDGADAVRASLPLRTPAFTDWFRVGFGAAVVLLAGAAAALLAVATRSRRGPGSACAVCGQEQVSGQDACPFCLAAAKARLVVQTGPAKGKEYPLVGTLVGLGSGPENAVRLFDSAVSGRHAGVSIFEGTFEILDLGSRNGVLVNGRRTQKRVLCDGDVLTLGTTQLRFEATGAQPVGDTAAEGQQS